ncbi:hypothetical protein [Streptomyces sp. NPDC090131]|uniref:hypothetical protein n=1 Tax=Streptomyces sp. NPDC090131 TaxID=3365954 RepID=UPI003821A296
MSVEHPDVHPLEQIARWVGEIWAGCPEATHLLFQVTSEGEACGLRAMRRVGHGYIPVEKRFDSKSDKDSWIFNDLLPWDELGAALEALITWHDSDPCPALAKESGGWWRLGLGQLVPEAEAYQAYEAHTMTDGHDTGALDAERGGAVLLAYLTAVREGRRATDVLAEHVGHGITVVGATGVTRKILTEDDQPPGTGTDVACGDCGTGLSDQWERPGNALAVGAPLASGDDVIDAVTALLHYADGWHHAQTVLDRALRILIQGQQLALVLPGLYDEVPDPRTLDALAAAVAAHYAAAARFSLTDGEVAKQSLDRFHREIEKHRLASVRAMRSAMAGLRENSR